VFVARVRKPKDELRDRLIGVKLCRRDYEELISRASERGIKPATAAAELVRAGLKGGE
jgi:hypothetical protein